MLDGSKEILRRNRQDFYLRLCKKLRHDRGEIVQVDAAQARLQVINDPRGRDEKITGKKGRANAILSRPFEPQECLDGAAGTDPGTAQVTACRRRFVNSGHEIICPDFLLVQCLRVFSFRPAQFTGAGGEAKSFTERRGQGRLDGRQARCRFTQQLAQRDHALRSGIEFPPGQLGLGTRSAETMVCGSMSTSTVPW